LLSPIHFDPARKLRLSTDIKSMTYLRRVLHNFRDNLGRSPQFDHDGVFIRGIVAIPLSSLR